MSRRQIKNRAALPILRVRACPVWEYRPIILPRPLLRIHPTGAIKGRSPLQAAPCPQGDARTTLRCAQAVLPLAAPSYPACPWLFFVPALPGINIKEKETRP